jgi:predicted  nucleic acid-binding Zn-ribbon protein
MLQRAAASQIAMEAARQRVKEVETQRKALELEVQVKKEQILRYANQQFQTRKNEEYRALQLEIDNTKAAIFDIENREIELMEQAEAAQGEVARATEAAAATRKMVEGQVAQLNAREQSLKSELTQVTTQRAQQAQAIDEGTRGKYERLLKSKGSNVVVGVQHGVCGGCHMKLPPQLLIACQAHKELVTCSNCGRILYHTRDMDMAVAE